MKYQGLCSFLLLGTLVLASCASNTDVDKEKTVEQKKAELYYGQGTNDLVKKNYNQALVNLLKAKEYDSKDSQIRNNLGMAYYFREQFELAEKELKQAIDLDSKNSDAKMNLATIYMEKNRIKEARALYEKVVQDLTYTSQFRTYYNMAILALKEGDRAEAYEFLFKSIKEREDYCQAHYKLGELYSEEYKFKDALVSFKESAKGTCVTEPAPHYQQGLTLMNLNRFEEARMKFKEITEKFSKTKFNTLASLQLKKISNEIKEQANIKTYQTEVIRERSSESQAVPTPNF